MPGYLKRLARTGAAYQLAATIGSFIGLALLPLYTRYLTPGEYGSVDLLQTAVILVSLIVRFGLVEAFVRFYYSDEDGARRDRLVRGCSLAVLAAVTGAAALGAVFAGPLSELMLGREDGGLLRVAVAGLWAYTNFEMATAVLRVDERAAAYLTASLIRVALTVGATLTLVVGLDGGAQGYLAGFAIGTTSVLLGVWFLIRRRFVVTGGADVPWRALLRFGIPTVPAEVSVFALNIIDRLYLYRVESPDEAGLYSLAVKFATVMILVARALQFAWPPLAYSIRDDTEASRIYAFVTTYYVLLTGTIVAAITLLGRWVLRVFAADSYFDAYQALPWVTLGWALYGLFIVFVVVAGRAKVTTRNFPAALAGLVVNTVLLLLLVPPLGIAGAGVALCGAYVTSLALMYLFTRKLFPVPFQWRRLALLVVVIGVVSVAGDLLLPTDGADGLLLRVLALLAIVPLLLVTGFFRAEEMQRIRALVRRVRSGRSPEPPPGPPAGGAPPIPEPVP